MIYHRITREMPQEVKEKISAKMQGRRLSPETKKKIADGQRKAWARIPYNSETNKEEKNGKNK